MGLSTTGEIVEGACTAGIGVGAFNVIGIEHAEAIVCGAEAVQAPVVLQVSENTVRFHRGRLEPIGLACLAIARTASVPVSVHLDHAQSVELCHEASALGLSSVMFDASTLSSEGNASATAAMAAFAHAHGMWIEAELGEIGGKDGVHAPGARTDPDDAARFVERTHVDALAVAIGTSHAMLTREAELDLDLLARIRQRVPVPLVMHGSSGVDDRDLGRAVAAGMVKVNVGTQLNQAFTGACRTVITSSGVVDPREYLRPARVAVSEAVSRLLQAIGTGPDHG
ncbi:MAG: class II fructose-bisphosphate aldolase [Acidimicrobiales bacterium]